MRHALMIGAVALALGGTPAGAQEETTANVVHAKPGAKPPSAELSSAAWLAGHWLGEGLGGVAEEIWSPPRAGSMMGAFRIVKGDAVSFYELMTLVEEEGSLVLRLRHFNPDLTGWEEKGETVDFPLVSVEDGLLRFDGLTILRRGDDAMTVYVALGSDDGGTREAAFEYERQRAP